MKTKYPMIVIEWEDPSFERGPHSEQWEKFRKPILVHDVGFLIYQNRNEVHIASALYPTEEEGILNATVLQRSLIKQMWTLLPGDRVRQERNDVIE